MATILEAMRLLQFGDSVLPVGSFTFSNGVESASQQGVVHDVESLRQFVRSATLQSATADGVGLLEAHRAALAGDQDRIEQIDQAVLNRKLNEETRTMSTRMGRKLAELAAAVVPSDRVALWLDSIREGATPGTYPVGQALVFSSLGVGEKEAFAAHQYGVASMMVQAALRLIRISHLDAQAILFEINALAPDDYDRVADARWEDMASFAPILDVMAAVHIQAHVRMFMD